MPKVIDKVSEFSGKKWILWAAFFCFLDQLSKYWIVKNIAFNSIKSIFPGLQLTLSYNRGIAFSFLSNQPQWGAYLLIFVVILFCVVIGRWVIRTPSTQLWEGFSLTLILGGAMGNVIDRLRQGQVIDFIDLYYGHFHWYTFNVADFFITLGALMLVRSIFCQGEVCQAQNKL